MRDKAVWDATANALRTTSDAGEAAGGGVGVPRDIDLAGVRMDRQRLGDVATRRAEVGGLNKRGEIGTEARDKGVVEATATALRATGDAGEAAGGRAGVPRDLDLARARMDRQGIG